MKKGMFCLLPLLVFTHVSATSTPVVRVDDRTVLVSPGTEKPTELSVPDTATTPTSQPKPIVSRPTSGQVPRSGRNLRSSRRVLIKR